MPYVYRYILLYLLVVGSCVLGKAQNEEDFWGDSFTDRVAVDVDKRPFSQEAWEKAKKGIVYVPIVKKKKRKREIGVPITPVPAPNISPNGTVHVIKIVLLIILILGVIWLVYRFLTDGKLKLNINKKAADGNLEVDIDTVEENLETASNLDQLVARAENRGTYAIAIRLYYLWIIKELSEKQYIRWRKNKTNQDYTRELKNTGYYHSFRASTKTFERVWYGDKKELLYENYRLLKGQMNAFVLEIQQDKGANL